MKKNSPTLNDTSLIIRNRDQIFSKIDEEVVMLNIDNGEYYYLDSVGSKIWYYIESPVTYAKLINLLIKEFDVSFETCDIETKEFLEELYKKGLIEIS